MDMDNRLDLFEITVALNSPEKATRNQAYEELIALGDEAVEPLIKMFPEIDGTARFHVIQAFGEIGDARARDVLLEVVYSEDPNEVLFATSAAAKSLGEIGAIDTLTTLLEEDRVTLRRMAATVLRHIDADEAVEALGRALTDEDEKVVKLSARALRSIGTPHAIALLDQHEKL